MSIDFNSAEQARKALHDIVAEQKRLKSQNRSLSENIDKKAADLAKVSKRLSEIESQGGAYTGSRGDGSLDKYIKRDGSVACVESLPKTRHSCRACWTTQPRATGNRMFKRQLTNTTSSEQSDAVAKPPRQRLGSMS